MKDFNLLIWLTQLGLSVAGPLTGFTLLSLWLRSRFDLGIWIILFGIALGLAGAVDGFRVSMKAMERMTKHKSGEAELPPVSFNDHN